MSITLLLIRCEGSLPPSQSIQLLLNCWVRFDLTTISVV
jgi:hypothetical protein